MNVTVIAFGVALLMVFFLFVDATGGQRNKTVVMVQLGVFLVAALTALVLYMIGGI